MGALAMIDTWPTTTAAVGVAGIRSGRSETIDVRGDVDKVLPFASVTKLICAICVLIATEEGSLSLDDSAGPPGSTVRHLLAHASGLAFDARRVLAPPGRRRIYSNVGFEVLGETLVDATGMSFAAYAREAVLDPLGMTRTSVEGSPAASGIGPLTDLVALCRELLSPTLLASETLRDATTVAFPGLRGVIPGIGRFNPCDWGLGFEIRDLKSPHWTGSRNSARTFGHFGGSGSFLWVDPDADLACACLSDRPFGPWALEAWPPLSDAILDEQD